MLNFFNRIKGIKEHLFKNIKRKESQSSISVNDLEEFLNKTSSEIQVVLDEDINQKYSLLIEEINLAKENLVKLEKAQLMNDKIGIKEKQIMEGNREEYLRKVRKFIDSLNITARGYLGAKELIKNTLVSFEELNTSIIKNFFVMQEFFAHESTAIAKNIKKIYSISQEFQSLIIHSKVNYLLSARNMYITLKSNYSMAKNFNDKIEAKKLELESVRIGREDIERKTAICKNNEEFKKFSSLVEQRDEVSNKLKTMELTFSQQFSQLDRPLRKLQRNSIHEKIIQEYLENSVTALIRDKQLKILLVFDELEKELVKDSLELKEKQKEKTTDVLKTMDKEFFENYAKEYQAIKHDKIDKDHLINVNQLMRDYNELDYKLQHLIAKSVRIIEEINEIEIIRNRLNNEELEKELQQEINKFKIINIVFFSKENVSSIIQESAENFTKFSAADKIKPEDKTKQEYKISSQQEGMVKTEL